LRTVRVHLPKVQMCAVTATLFEKDRTRAVKLLGMNHVTWVEEQFSRDNLVFRAYEIDGGGRALVDFMSSLEMKRLIHSMQKPRNDWKADDPPRTIVFFQNTELLSKAHEIFRGHLPSSDWQPSVDSRVDLTTVMFHSGTGEKTKAYILGQLNKPAEQSRLRVIFSTSALALGVNTSDVLQIIHFMPPKTLEDYVQQAGRAGRENAHRDRHLPVILFYTAASLGNVDPVMSSYATARTKNRMCRRQVIFTNASPNHKYQPIALPMRCCDVCRDSWCRKNRRYSLAFDLCFPP